MPDAPRNDPTEPRRDLDALSPPAPRRSFVDDTLAALERDADVRLSRLLASYTVPPPSADFVARTLTRLAADAPVAAPRRLAWIKPLAAAAVLMLGAALWLRWSTPDAPRAALAGQLADALGELLQDPSPGPGARALRELDLAAPLAPTLFTSLGR